jgi:hypothetical protein
LLIYDFYKKKKLFFPHTVTKDKHFFFFLIFILFIRAYNVWVISPPFPHPHPLPYPDVPSLSPHPHPFASWQKLFCPKISISEDAL